MAVKRICRNFLGTELLFLAVLVSSTSVQGGVVTFDLKDATRDTGWSMQYDDSQVTVLSFTGLNDPDNKRLEGTLTFDKVFNNLNSIEVKFIESVAEIAKDDSFGLRINMFENITNQSGVAWGGFTMDLQDPSAGSGQETSAHPGFAHFFPVPAPSFRLR